MVIKYWLAACLSMFALVNETIAEQIRCPSQPTGAVAQGWSRVEIGKKRSGANSMIISNQEGVDVREDSEIKLSAGKTMYVWDFKDMDYSPSVKCSYRAEGLYLLYKLPQLTRRCFVVRNAERSSQDRTMQCE